MRPEEPEPGRAARGRSGDPNPRPTHSTQPSRGAAPVSPPPTGLDRIRADQERMERQEREQRTRLLKTLGAVAATIVLVIFVVANDHPVQVNFVFITRHPRLIWVMILCALLGGTVGYLLGRPGRQLRWPGRKRGGPSDPGAGGQPPSST